MKKINDQLGRTIEFRNPPQRIVSFAPAITDTLYSLHLEEEIVGRTRFCIHPKGKVEKAMNVGGTKDMKIDRVRALNPDLIICEKEENTKEMVAELEKHYPVYVFEIQTYSDALNMISGLGELTDRTAEAQRLKQHIESAFDSIPTPKRRKRAAYIIWQHPYMVVGKHTYIHSLLGKLGYENPFVHFPARYPTVTEDDLRAADLDTILLATEPFPFGKKHLDTFSQLLPDADLKIVDGEMFWYGVKMLEAAEYFKQTLLR